MGRDVSLHIGEPSIAGFSPSRSFLYQVVDTASGGIDGVLRLAKVLTKEEQEALRPNESGEAITGTKGGARGCIGFFTMLPRMRKNIEGTDMADPFEHILEISEKVEDREREPLPLKLALIKLNSHLRFTSDDLPLVHMIYPFEENNPREQSVKSWEEFTGTDGTTFKLNGWFGHVDSAREMREKIQVFIRHDTDPVTWSTEYHDVEPPMDIFGLQFKVITHTMFERYNAEFEELFSVLDRAITDDRNVLWEWF